MTKEMAGTIEDSESYIALRIPVGEIPSSFDGGKSVDITAPVLISLEDIKKAARGSGVTNTDFESHNGNIVREAEKVTIVGGEFSYTPTSVVGAANKAAVVLETSIQNTENPTPDNLNHAKNVEENLRGLGAYTEAGGKFTKKEQALFSKLGLRWGRASEVVSGQEGEKVNPVFGKFAQKGAEISSVIILAYNLAGCNPVNASTQVEKTTPTSSPIVEVTPATSTPTVVPTEVPTPTEAPLSADNFKVENGQIEENVGGSWQTEQIPSEVGEIAGVELHEGQMYGIDTADRAVVVRNATGEWVKFDRPILGDDFDNFHAEDVADGVTITWKIDASGLDTSDVQESDIVRLTNEDGSVVDWGYQKGSSSWGSDSGELPQDGGVVNFAGYFVGKISLSSTDVFHKTNKTFISPFADCYVFEIPYKYNRQLILIGRPDITNAVFDVNFGNKEYRLSSDDLRGFLDSNLSQLRGKESVINLTLDPLQDGDQKLWQAVGENQAYGYLRPQAINSFAQFNSNFSPN